MRILFASDLHGDEPLYEAVIRHASGLQPDCVLLGGDLLPKSAGNDQLVGDQRRFLNGPFDNFLKRLRNDLPKTRIVAMLGNDDCEAVAADLEALERQDLLQTAHNGWVSLGNDWMLFGFHLVPETPFPLKDHERLDLERSGVRFPGRGVCSCEQGLVLVSREAWFDGLPSLQAELARIEPRADMERCVFMSHAPPWGTPLDMMASGSHVGSRAIRDFIEKRGPKLAFHGHIHEAFHESGLYWHRLGDTLCFNPGQIHQPILDAVSVEICDDSSKVIHGHLGANGGPSSIGLERLKAPLEDL